MPDCLVASCTRFLSEVACLDPATVYNKYFQSDILEKACEHLFISNQETKIMVSASILKQLTSKTNRGCNLLAFVRMSCERQSVFAKSFIKSYEGLEKVILWLEFTSNILKQQLAIDGHRESQ